MPSITYDALGFNQANISSYSVSEEITPLDPSSYTGAVGQVTVEAKADLYGTIGSGFVLLPSAPGTIGDQAVLDDPQRGTFQSIIREMSGTDGSFSYTSDSVLSRFNTIQRVLPMSGTLETVIQSLLDVVDIDLELEVDDDIASISVVLPGFQGSVWDRIKEIMSAHSVELALVADKIVVRKPLANTAYMNRRTTQSFNVNASNTARSVTIYYYDTDAAFSGSRIQLWPTLSEEHPPPLVVGAGETLVQRLQMDGTALSVSNPTAVDFVDDESYDGTTGVYAVSGSDGLPITASQWTAMGGSLTVEVDDDPSFLVVTVVGANIPDLSPMRLAMSAGSSSYYNSLHITGYGTRWERRQITIPTGASPLTSSPNTVIEVDNPQIQTLAKAYSAGMYAVRRACGPTYTINGTAMALNQPDEDTSAVVTFTTFDQWVTDDEITTFDDFDTVHDGQTFANIDAALATLTTNLFAAQLFGNGIGAKIEEPNNTFRITTTTTTASTVDYTAELATTFADFDAHWTGATFDDFDIELTAGTTFQDLTIDMFQGR